MPGAERCPDGRLVAAEAHGIGGYEAPIGSPLSVVPRRSGAASASTVLGQRCWSRRSDSQLHGLPAVNHEGFALVEAADVVGVDDVAVPGSLAAEAGVV